MSLESRITAVVQAIATDIKSLLSKQGDLTTLSTTAKGNLVSAINELSTAIASGSSINDAAASNSTNSAYSANKITTLLNTLKGEILGGASASYDTLIEIQTLLQGDATAISGLLAAVNARALSSDIGDTDHNFVTDYTAAKV
jgi:uncharacterized protein YejL (UPF0352 family)